jgi:hypothetical protein
MVHTSLHYSIEHGVSELLTGDRDFARFSGLRISNPFEISVDVIATYYADFTAFTHAIEDCLTHTQTTHKQILNSLLTFNFQSFKKVQSLTV